MSETDHPDRSSDSGSTLLNAVIGAVATIVLAFVPLSPVLGGALAGYLQGEDTGAGLRVGALSGALATIPLVLGLVLFGGFFTVMTGGMDPRVMPGVGAFSLVFVAFALVFGVLYTVGLSALGGLLGAYVKREMD